MRFPIRNFVVAVSAVIVASLSGLTECQAQSTPASRLVSDKPPLVIGHRGASGYRPEHTLAAYELAINLGVDFIEPDLVSTKDGVLVARHENEIGGTTDVASHPEFASRRTTKTIDGLALTGWFTEDFTLAELQTLRAVERIPAIRQRSTVYNGLYQVPTLQQVIDLAKRKSLETGRVIGIYPETKHPSYFRGIGLPLEEPLLATLRRNGLDRRDAPVFIQSFEVGNLRQLRSRTRIRLVQLFGGPADRPADFVATGVNFTYGDMATPAGLARIASYADGIGPPKSLIVPRDAAGNSLTPTTLIADAHAVGLIVHPYTFRNENTFLPNELRVGDPANAAFPTFYGRAFDEYRQFFDLGVDGLFSDNGDTAVEARRLLLNP
ncbi:glycerophosphodiester phosphodiesterase [Nevskia ramosa]|uniref:glycerophosphodiester phosphodiesterase n=1 Tax=Nevskia ramosa TaxID=64002 RepID=UPI0003B2EDA0|nr:glycerophosphodiester phosphodiesterase [Nevskia ramosa]